MLNWLRWPFKRKPIIGYRVISHAETGDEDMGVFNVFAEDALEEAQMLLIKRHFASGSIGAFIGNLEAVPVRASGK